MGMQFDELSKSLAEGISRRETLRRFGIRLTVPVVLAMVLAAPVRAEDLYVNVSSPPHGSGTINSPYARITDAVVRARADRQNRLIPASETIVIHVAPGAYVGQFAPSTNTNEEILPIVLNVPNLVLQGSTILTADSAGVPTGVAENGHQSIISSKDDSSNFLTALLIIVRTTDSSAGDAVTVAGFTFTGNASCQGIIADHVSHFSIAGNIISGAYANVYSRAASGTIAGNLLLSADTIGYIGEGGTGRFPSTVSVTRNRISDNGEIGAVGVTYPSDMAVDLGGTGLTALSFQFGGNDPDMPNGFVLAVRGNHVCRSPMGIRLFVAPLIPNAQSIRDAGTPTLLAIISGNSIHNSDQYGLVVDGGDAPPGFAPYSGTVLLFLAGNSISGSGIQPGLFTFYNYFDTIEETHENDGHLQRAVYRILDLDGELTGFDYYNPILDRATGTPNNDTLFVNGSRNITGRKLSFKP